jgi:hypothetical protein
MKSCSSLIFKKIFLTRLFPILVWLEVVYLEICSFYLKVLQNLEGRLYVKCFCYVIKSTCLHVGSVVGEKCWACKWVSLLPSFRMGTVMPGASLTDPYWVSSHGRLHFYSYYLSVLCKALFLEGSSLADKNQSVWFPSFYKRTIKAA